MSCCTLHINETFDDGGGGGDTHANIGTGVDIYEAASSSPANFRRLQAIDRGAVALDDFSGGLEVLAKPGDVDTNLVRWKNFYVEDLTSDFFSSTSFITVSTWNINGASGEEDFILHYGVLTCSGSSNSNNEIEVRLLVDGVQVDRWQTEDNVHSLPSVPQTRVIRANLSGAPDPFVITIQARNRHPGFTGVVEDKTLWGILYEDP